MIKNKKQLSEAKEQLENFDSFIEHVINELQSINTHKVKIELQENALKAQKEKLKFEIEEYEKLFLLKKINIQNIYDLPKAIIQIRLLSNMSINQLAAKIEFPEQEIINLEAQEYNKATLERVIQIIDALDMKVSITIEPK